MKNLKNISIDHRQEYIKAMISAGTSSRFVAIRRMPSLSIGTSHAVCARVGCTATGNPKCTYGFWVRSAHERPPYRWALSGDIGNLGFDTAAGAITDAKTIIGLTAVAARLG